ncbi:MFS transporter [Candidatus Aerophobetes bacterium]|uniref:MFS transporter n=1 Tax=Aerophobetes bacterium TaxID=2030807 RepID=A0A523WE01_UNCAE|nr:MAG: MFS transporter [Candidatus Aerophobetes bacterium]
MRIPRSSGHLLRVAWIGHGLNDMYWFILPVLLPMIKQEFSLSYARAGLLVTSLTAVIAVGSLVSGYLGDHFGRRTILSGGFVFVSLALIFCGLSGSYWQLLAAVALVGAGVSTFHPSMIALLMDMFSRKRGAVLGTFTLWGWVGTALGLMAISYLTGRGFSWRQVYLVMALPGLVLFPLLYRALGPSAKRHPSPRKEEVERVYAGGSNLPALAVFFAANMAIALTFFGVTNFLPTFMVETKAFSVETASYLFVIFVGGGMIGSLVSGRLSDLFPPLLVILAAAVGVIPVIFLLTLGERLISLAILLVLFGICCGGIYPPQNAYLADLTSIYTRGRIYGLIQCCTILVGAFAPGIMGLMADKIGLSLAMKLSILPLALAVLPLFYLKRR